MALRPALLLLFVLACREPPEAKPRVAPALHDRTQILRQPPARDLLLEDIAHHERQWKAARPARYELVLEIRGFGGTRRARITVEGAQLVAVDTSAGPSQRHHLEAYNWMMVEGLFNDLRSRALYAEEFSFVKYHPTFGYPEHIYTDGPHPGASDVWSETRVLGFRPQVKAAP